MKRISTKTIWSLASVLALASAAGAATINGSLTDDSGKPLAGVKVTVPALQKGAATGADGSFSLEVPAGSYVVQFRSSAYATETRKVAVTDAGASVAVKMHQTPIEIAPITITAAPQATDTLHTPASVSVIAGRELERQKGQSVMSSIQDVPGVNMISEGPTVVKPIIRGLNSQDIVIAQDGVREEFIQWGNEHAPEIDSQGVDRIEVLRGANSLMYGSDALGGVISVSHPELPNAALGDGPLSGKVTGDLHTVNNSVGQGAMLQGASGDWGWRTNLSQRHAGNISTPDTGVIPNTGEHEAAGDGTVGVRKDWGSLTMNYDHFDKMVELQNAIYPNLTDDEFQILIHDHGSLHANVQTPLARVEFIQGYDRSNREEFNNNDNPQNPAAEFGAHWIETSYTTDVKAHLAPMGPFQGTLGFSGVRRIEEQLTPLVHLTPAYNTNGTGEYLFEEAAFGDFNFSAGIRADQNHYTINADPLIGADTTPHPVARQSLNYSAVTGAIGGVYHITDPLSFAVNIGRGYRNPVPFELFAYGVHEGAGVFQIGNPGLQPEVSLNTDASLRWASDRLKAEAGVFRNYISNFIYGQFTGATMVDPNTGTPLPVVQEQQSRATIQGFDFTAKGAATDWLTLSGGGNLVRGYNDSGDPSLNGNVWLPHVPADNVRGGAEVHQKSLGALSNPYFGADLKLTNAQRRASPYAIPTAGYGLVGLHAGTELVVMNNRLSFDAGVENLLNKGYFDYDSIVKEFGIENPGRDVYFKLSVPFGS